VNGEDNVFVRYCVVCERAAPSADQSITTVDNNIKIPNATHSKIWQVCFQGQSGHDLLKIFRKGFVARVTK